MLNKQFDNDNFILYAPDSLKYITDGLDEILNKSLEFYKKLFDVVSFRKVHITFFDKVEDFRNYIYELRGEKESLPSYARGTFDNGMIIACIDPNIIEGTPLFHKVRFNSSHELFHIMYQELVWEKNGWDRIEWFDEGMAQLFSGEIIYRIGDDFKSWFDIVLKSTKIIPNLKDLKHGNGFENENYSGYDLSLLAVKYLYDKLGFEEFQKLINDNDKIAKYGNNILNEAIEYYKNESHEQ